MALSEYERWKAMEAGAYLSRVAGARTRLRTLADAMADVYADMEGIRAIDYATAQVRGGMPSDALDAMLDAKEARLSECQRQAHELEALLARAMYCLGRMPDQGQAALLEARYINGRAWAEVAEGLGCSERHVFQVKPLALAAFYDSMMERDKPGIPPAI